MQEEKLQLRTPRAGALPILNGFIERMGLEEELSAALKNTGYADALLALMKNILVDRSALYAVREWIELFEPRLSRQITKRGQPDASPRHRGAPFRSLHEVRPGASRRGCPGGRVANRLHPY